MNTENTKTIRLELNDNAFWAIIVFIVAVALYGIVSVSSFYYTERVKEAFAAGYEETTTQGNSQLVWSKHK